MANTSPDDIDIAPPSKPKFWNDPQFRALAFQIIFLAIVLSGVAYIINNTLHNLEQRGISTGFAFLWDEAGFGILQTLIPYNETYSFGRTFIVGLLNTVLVSFLGIIFATLLGFTIGVARLSSNWLIAKLALVYIEIFRNVPLLLQIFFWYFSVLRTLPSPRQSLEFQETIFLNIRGLYLPAPVLGEGFWLVWLALGSAIVAIIVLARWAKRRQNLTGQTFPVLLTSLALLLVLPSVAFVAAGAPLTWEIPELKGFNFSGGIAILPELTALTLALTIYTAAFIAENVRSGIEAVSHGQTEAASALGLKEQHVLNLVIIPQALRVIIPPLTNQYLNLTKNSSLATAIGYPDLVSVFAGTTLNQTGQAVEIIAMTMAVYLTLSLLISVLMNWYNKSIQLVER